MIDLHCHILPGIDDGALDLSDSIAMARVAEADGITRIAATPHIRHDHDVRIAELPERVAEVNDELSKQGLCVQVLVGGEVAETALDGLDEDELEAVSLGGGGWILLEPRPGAIGDSLLEAVTALGRAGFRALIAHPERHLGADLFDRLRELVNAGALIQGTAAYLVSGSAQPGMLAMATAGLIHILASDAHSSHGGRPLQISEGLATLADVERVGPHLQWVAVHAPAAILRGEYPAPPYDAG